MSNLFNDAEKAFNEASYMLDNFNKTKDEIDKEHKEAIQKKK